MKFVTFASIYKTDTVKVHKDSRMDKSAVIEKRGLAIKKACSFQTLTISKYSTNKSEDDVQSHVNNLKDSIKKSLHLFFQL